MRYADLERIDGTTAEVIDLSTGTGFARLRVDLDDGVTVAATHTGVSGWSLYSTQAEAETCGVPFLQGEAFSGKVKADAAGVLDVSDSAGTGSNGVSAQMDARPHYIEIVSGSYAGHRFEVASATAQSITLENGAARNTLDPLPDLTGASFVMLAHRVLDDVAAAPDFVDLVTHSNNDDPATAGRVFLYDPTNGWSTFFAYNDGGSITPQWTSSESSSLKNVGDAIISGSGDHLVIVDPVAGLFLHPKAQAVDLMLVGAVRSWDFACPLAPGYNFVGAGYPIDQSPAGRDMSLAYFTGTPDPFTADRVDFWVSDGSTFGLFGYDSHFRVLSGSSYDYWTTQEGSSLPNEDLVEMFDFKRACFIRSALGHDKSDQASVWLWPVPWAP